MRLTRPHGSLVHKLCHWGAVTHSSGGRLLCLRWLTHRVRCFLDTRMHGNARGVEQCTVGWEPGHGKACALKCTATCRRQSRGARPDACMWYTSDCPVLRATPSPLTPGCACRGCAQAHGRGAEEQRDRARAHGKAARRPTAHPRAARHRDHVPLYQALAMPRSASMFAKGCRSGSAACCPVLMQAAGVWMKHA